MAFLQFPQILVMRWSLTDFSRHNIQAKARMIFSPVYIIVANHRIRPILFASAMPDFSYTRHINQN